MDMGEKMESKAKAKSVAPMQLDPVRRSLPIAAAASTALGQRVHKIAGQQHLA